MSDEEKIEETLKEIEESTDISVSELAAVSGSTSFCLFVGFGNEPDAEFFSDESRGACAYAGVTMAKFDL